VRDAVVVGTGLIGTSVALALTRHGVQVHLRDADEAAAKTAAALGAGTLRSPDAPVDLAVVAVPPAQAGRELARAQQASLAAAYTDVASVKGRVRADLCQAGGDIKTYVGGHPLSGRERSGPLAATADLFEGRRWVLTPSADTLPTALERATELVALCGGTPVIMEEAEHDRAVALTSHAPHLVSTLLATLLADAAQGILEISGPGLADMTRIAGADAALWHQILTANAAAVAEVLDRYGEQLASARDALRDVAGAGPAAAGHGTAALTDLLNEGVNGHHRVPRAPADLVTVSVPGSGQPGTLGRLLATVAAADITLEDLRLEHAADGWHGSVRLQVKRVRLDRPAHPAVTPRAARPPV